MADRALLPAILEALPLPTLAIDRNERIIALNAKAQSLVGAGALARHFVTILRQPALVEAVERSLGDGKPRHAPFLAGDVSKPLTYDVSLSTVETTGTLIVSFQDITHEAEAGQMRRDFVANVSHELRTPLTSLMGFIETLGGPARNDAAARDRFLQIMSDEAGRMNRLIGDLLSLSRVEAEARVKPTAKVDLTDILGTTLRNLTPLAQERDVSLVAAFSSDPMPLMGDADQLVQVFTNLVENAIKYGAAHQPVEISAETSLRDPALRGPAVRITVTDHGPGIAPMHLPRLTERFYRADSHRSRKLGGTGLGLAIVKHILNRHRGRLKITSEIGQGSAFTVILPLDVPAA